MGDLFQELVFDKLVDIALKQLFTSVPALGWGPIGWLTSFAVKKFATFMYKNIKEFLVIEAIAFRNKSLLKEYTNQSVKLKLVARNGFDTKEYQDAKKIAHEAMDNVISFNVASAS